MKHHYRRRAALVAVTLVAGALALSNASPASAAVSEQNLTFMQFNMSGNMGHGGLTDLNNGGLTANERNPIVGSVSDVITAGWPNVIGLNEVCANQAMRIVAVVNTRARAAGRAPYAGHFGLAKAAHVGGDCGASGTPHNYGNFIMTNGTNNITEPAYYIDGQDPNRTEARNMVCIRSGFANNTVRIRACSAHWGGDASRYDMMRTVSDRWLKPWAESGTAVLFLGDTYLTEAEMRYSTGGLYGSTGVGATWPNPWCSRVTVSSPSWPCRSTASPKQFDHAMVSTNRSRNRSGWIGASPWSDHKPVHGRATVRSAF